MFLSMWCAASSARLMFNERESLILQTLLANILERYPAFELLGTRPSPSMLHIACI